MIVARVEYVGTVRLICMLLSAFVRMRLNALCEGDGECLLVSVTI